jgi:hypothetical protein
MTWQYLADAVISISENGRVDVPAGSHAFHVRVQGVARAPPVASFVK